MVGLCDSITHAWSEIEDCSQELLGFNYCIFAFSIHFKGRIAVVLESEKTIELIKVQNKNSEIVLIVEPLNL